MFNDAQTKQNNQRTGRCVIVTRVETHPRPAQKVRDSVDLNVTWLLSQLEADSSKTNFTIDRSHEKCRTPRRNPECEEALTFFHSLERWCSAVNDYFRNELFPVQEGHGLDMGSINDDAVFVPVVPLFEKRAAQEKQGAAASAAGAGAGNKALVAVNEPKGQVVLSRADLACFLEEERRSLAEKGTELGKVFPDAAVAKVVSIVEARVCLAVGHLRNLTAYFEAGVDCIESMLRKQLIGSIGKEVSAVDFGNYMVYHNRKFFRAPYQPKPFSYAVRRPDHYPEGVITIEQVSDDGSIPIPIQTLVKASPMEAPMQFALNAGATVSFTGDVYVHGYMMHSFGGSKGLRLQLCARARQFSSFLVLVGRVVGAGLFEPQFGLIVQNKDEVTIPLDLETIPSAAEFKAATVSISPEQQAFAKMFRGMQLSSTLFAVCTLQIKPQLEKLLRLAEDSLTKEIRLTQDLMQLFVQYQLPSDLLSFGGATQSAEEVRLCAVKRNVRLAQVMVEAEQLKQQLDALDVEEKAALVNPVCVYCKTLSGRTITLHILLSETVAAAKRMIQLSQGIPPDQQRLIFAGFQMEDHRSLSSYGVGDGATFHLVLRLRGGPGNVLESTRESGSSHNPSDAERDGLVDGARNAIESIMQEVIPEEVAQASVSAPRDQAPIEIAEKSRDESDSILLGGKEKRKMKPRTAKEQSSNRRKKDMVSKKEWAEEKEYDPLGKFVSVIEKMLWPKTYFFRANSRSIQSPTGGYPKAN